jgi:hypothetical protein
VNCLTFMWYEWHSSWKIVLLIPFCEKWSNCMIFRSRARKKNGSNRNFPCKGFVITVHFEKLLLIIWLSKYTEKNTGEIVDFYHRFVRFPSNGQIKMWPNGIVLRTEMFFFSQFSPFCFYEDTTIFGWPPPIVNRGPVAAWLPLPFGDALDCLATVRQSRHWTPWLPMKRSLSSCAGTCRRRLSASEIMTHGTGENWFG